MTNDQLIQKEKDELISRFEEFQRTMDDVNAPHTRVFKPLKEWQIKEIMLIREVSKDLQKKIEDDALKAKQAAEEVKTEKEAEKELEKEDA